MDSGMLSAALAKTHHEFVRQLRAMFKDGE